MSNIKGITIEIEGKTTGLERALKDINKESAKTSIELSKINKGLKFNPGNTELVAQKQQVLSKQIENTSTKLKALKGAQSQVEAQFKSGNLGEDKYRAFQRELVETEGKLKQYTNQLANVDKEQSKWEQNNKNLANILKSTKTTIDDYSDVLGQKLVAAIKNGQANADQLDSAFQKIAKSSGISQKDVAQLKREIDQLDDTEAVAHLSSEFERLDKTTSELPEKVQSIQKGINAQALMQGAEIVANAGAKVKEFGEKSLEAFSEVDAGLDAWTAKTGRNSDEIQQHLDNITSDMAVESFKQVGDALGEVNTQLDFTDERLESAAKYALKFAEINETDVTQAVQLAKKAIESYDLTNEDFERVLDSVTATSQRTGVAVDALMDSAVKGAPQIKALNLTFEEGVEVLGQLAKAGIDGDNAFSLLSKANVNYAKSGKTLRDGLSETINQIKNAKSETEALTLASEVFGTKGASKMVEAIKRGALSFDDLAKAAQQSQGSVEQTFETMRDPNEELQLVFQEQAKAMAELGAVLSETLVPILREFSQAIRGVAEWFRSLDGDQQKFIVLTGILTAAFSALLPVIAAVVAIAGALGVAISTVGAIIGAIIGVIMTIAFAITHWDEICKILASTWEWLAQLASDVWNAILTTISQFVQGALEKVEGIRTGISNAWDAVINVTKNIWNSVFQFISDKINGAKNAVKNAIDAIKGFLNFKWKWPHIPMPHFSISGSINPIDWFSQGVPKINVEWYAKGGIMKAPTVFGRNGNNLMVGGEAGPEAILPLNKDTLGTIGQAIASQMNMGYSNDLLMMIVDLLEQLLRKDTNMYLDGREVANTTNAYHEFINQQKKQRIARLKGARV